MHHEATIGSREPLLNRATITALVNLLVVTIGAFGVAVSDDVSQNLVIAITGIAGVLGPLVAAWWARSHVTPLSDPRDNRGNPLAVGGATTPEI